MKRYFAIAAVLLCLGMLASCGKEQGAKPAGTGPQIENTRLTVDFGVQTYAPITWAAEKRLYSVAFFIQTPDGEFHKFFSTEPLKSEYGFENATKTGSNYTKVEIVMPKYYDGQGTLAVVGNYDNDAVTGNGLADELLAVESMDELMAMQLAAPATGPGIRLLTYNLSTLQFTSGLPVATNVVMKRAAARVDVSVAFDLTDDDADVNELMNDGLIECFALVYNPKQTTYLLPPTVAQMDAVGQMERFDKKTVSASGTFSFYTYEMSGNDTAPLTLYFVLRTRQSTADDFVDKMWSFEIVNTEGKCRIVRNSAYALGTLTFNIDVAGLDEGGDIIFTPAP